MRRCLLAAILLALSPPLMAQQPLGTTGEMIGYPPPLPGPPPLTEPAPAATPSREAPSVQAKQPPSSGAPAPTDTPPQASSGTLPVVSTGPGLISVGPDGISTKTVKAVPCGLVARETDGFTTCVGIPDKPQKTKRR
jgi:hypothetical protein